MTEVLDRLKAALSDRYTIERELGFSTCVDKGTQLMVTCTES